MPTLTAGESDWSIASIAGSYWGPLKINLLRRQDHLWFLHRILRDWRRMQKNLNWTPNLDSTFYTASSIHESFINAITTLSWNWLDPSEVNVWYESKRTKRWKKAEKEALSNMLYVGKKETEQVAFGQAVWASRSTFDSAMASWHCTESPVESFEVSPQWVRFSELSQFDPSCGWLWDETLSMYQLSW